MKNQSVMISDNRSIHASRIIRHLAHSLKGSVGNLAADDVHAAAMALEKLVGKNSDAAPSKDGLKHWLDQLDNAVAIVFSIVGSVGAEIKTVVPTDGDIFVGIPDEKHEALVAQMKSAAEIGDIIEIQAIAEELEREFGDNQVLSRRIVELVDTFDLDSLVKLAENGSS